MGIRPRGEAAGRRVSHCRRATVPQRARRVIVAGPRSGGGGSVSPTASRALLFLFQLNIFAFYLINHVKNRCQGYLPGDAGGSVSPTVSRALLFLFLTQYFCFSFNQPYPAASITRALLGFWILTRAALGFCGRINSYVVALSDTIPRARDNRFKQRRIGQHAHLLC